ncbi:F0F1 ATP synthase subunit B/delta [Gordonia pseudamarae]|uniref:ATP synthase subunit delta n=1 Tax=Gordonia pseudamarae TaxID=2831662 RepID=A0ABX6IG70_9ACTN|nr:MULTISPECIES: F0F1 ATP synthase subunit B/delta [Gordonia]MBD0023265.1 F0F1 ATP synthase subunit B/delta [Gordonia sp. (in: high G+C Gram-positive bacteria)]QHN25912.1 F0F1 ATP synthase subunit B/delta [Gordonia pseudamarae]QHN34842.1 F0F1 ATP synthase subunit B/delta [Gordonia pseudamarae]
MEIFIGQLVGFAVVAFLIWKFVVPLLKKAVKNTQDTIGQQIADSESAEAKAKDAAVAHERAVENAKVEGEKLRENAVVDAENIVADLRVQADREVRRISEGSSNQGDLVRSTLVRKLRTDLGLSAVDQAGDLVRGHLADPAAKEQSVDRVISELEAMSAATPATHSRAELIGIHSLRATSRDAAQAVAEAFEADAAGKDAASLVTASDDLTQIIGLLDKNPVLRKKLTEDDEFPQGKTALVNSLFAGKASPVAVDIVAAAARQRWSTTADFGTALRRQNSLVVLAAAERDGTIESVEDELFRVSRLLDANPQLASLLSDYNHDADNRIGLLGTLIGGKVGAHTQTLLAHTVRLLHGQPMELAVGHLAELAAARRGESVAHVISASQLTDAQIQRLGGVLANIYGRPVSVQTEVDEAILGGLRIAVGDEVIEADIATRLATAAQTLPR